MLDYIRRMNEEMLISNILRKKKGKISKFVHSGNNNWNEREGNWHHGMDRQRKIEEESKTLSTVKCETLIFCT